MFVPGLRCWPVLGVCVKTARCLFSCNLFQIYHQFYFTYCSQYWSCIILICRSEWLCSGKSTKALPNLPTLPQLSFLVVWVACVLGEGALGFPPGFWNVTARWALTNQSFVGLMGAKRLSGLTCVQPKEVSFNSSFLFCLMQMHNFSSFSEQLKNSISYVTIKEI